MSERVVDFLVELSKDPHRIEEYKRDPDSVLAASGLPDEDCELLRSNDIQKIREALGHHGHGHPPWMVFVVVTRTNG